MKQLSLAVALTEATPAAVAHLLADCAEAGFGQTEEVVLAIPRPQVGLAEVQRVFDEGGGGTLVVVDGEASLMTLWGAAMAGCVGEYIAVVDGRDRLSRGWLAAFRAPREEDIVCGPVEPPLGANATTEAAYLSEYGQFQGPLGSGPLEEYPGNNIVFARASLPDATSLRRDGFWKTFHLDRLRKARRTVAIAVREGLSVRFDRRYTLTKYLWRRYLHGRCYGGKRLQEPGCPPRVLCLLFTPALPVLRTLRVIRRTARKPGAARRLARAAAPLLLGEVSWSVGEAAGYSLGAGDCCQRVT